MRRIEYGHHSRERQVLAFVHARISEEGVAPSYQEICNALGIGTRTEVCAIVRRLEDRGKLRRVGSGRVRRIKLEWANG